MPGEKRFRTSFMGGFKKKDVNIYIEKILKEFDDKLKDKDDEIAALKNQSREYRLKYEELFRNADQINEDRAKIVEVLIKAQEKAQTMIDDARKEALEEKKRLDGMLEEEKEKLVDVKREVKFLRSEVINALKKYEIQLDNLAEDENDEAV